MRAIPRNDSGIRNAATRLHVLPGREQPTVERAHKIELDPTMTCAEAFRIIASSGFRQLAANEPAVRPAEPEALHQMRIGLRRLRVVMSIFRGFAVDGQLARVRDELKWLAGALGPARDLDVFIAEVLAPMQQEHPQDLGLVELRREIEVRRAGAYAEVTATLRSGRYRALLQDAAAWIEAGPSAAERSLSEWWQRPVIRLASEQLGCRRRRLAKAGKNFRAATAAERHRLRIRGKKLRYAAEFFVGLFPRKRVMRRHKAMIRALKELQDGLGELNDIATRAKLIDSIVTGDGADRSACTLAFAAGLVAGREQARTAALLDSAAQALARIGTVKPFWH